jgi:ATP/maltotriose-dependent transcriptional regulator MalT
MHTELMVDSYPLVPEKGHAVMFGGDQRALARGTLARILWLQGFPDRAMREMRESCEVFDEDLSIISHRLITFACPVALWTGDLEEVERFSDILQEFTAERASEMRDYSNCIAGELFLVRGDAKEALALVRPAVEALKQRGAVQHLTWQLSVMARVLAQVGQTAEALAALDEALSRCRQFGEDWCRPELIRLKAEVLRAASDRVAPGIERQLSAALALAHRQGARSWELRIATTLARLRLSEGRRGDALDVLRPIYEDFTEGFSTPDVQAASDILQACAREPEGLL